MKHASSHHARIEMSGSLRLPDAILYALTSILVALYVELFREAVNAFRDGDAIGLLSFAITPSACVVIAVTFAITFTILLLLHAQGRILHALFRWRYPIALAILVALVVAQINGSSLALWSTMLDNASSHQLDGMLFGIPRSIRSDEYLVFTPMALSQEHTGYAAYSDLVRAVPTNLTLIYAQPAWALATLFRPFLWGYLIVGSSTGLAFFWSGRLVALFLASFEFGRFITHDNRPVALAYALLISFAPTVQWWFAVNGMAELLVFSQVGILAFASFLRAETRVRRFGMAALAAYSAGCFVLIVYPAWQVCMAYFIVAFCVADVVHCRKNDLGVLARGRGALKAFTSSWLALICALAIVIVAVMIALTSSLDVIEAVRNSAYPGNRVETGGGLAPLLFDWAAAWLYPIAPDQVMPNACERASMFTLFPLGILCSLAILHRRKDPYLIALIIAEIILLAYGIVGFPEPLAKLTLLSNVTTQRLVLAIGTMDIVLLVRSTTMLHELASETGSSTLAAHAKTNTGAGKSPHASHIKKDSETGRSPHTSHAKTIAIAACSLAFGLFCAAMAYLFNGTFAFKLFLAMIGVFVALGAFVALSFASGRLRSQHLVGIAAVIALAGLCVNPVQQGITPLQNDDLLGNVKGIVQREPSAIWAGDNDVASQALIASGARTITSVAIYPDLNTWRKLDPTGTYEDVYNRYAHISLKLTSQESSFETNSPDAFDASVNVNDLEKLGVDYWLSQENLERHNTDQIAFTPLKSNGVWTIYRISRQ